MKLSFREDCLTKNEVASIFDRHPRTIELWVKQGLLHPIKLGNEQQSHVLFTKTDVQNLINKFMKGE